MLNLKFKEIVFFFGKRGLVFLICKIQAEFVFILVKVSQSSFLTQF